MKTLLLFCLFLTGCCTTAYIAEGVGLGKPLGLDGTGADPCGHAYEKGKLLGPPEQVPDYRNGKPNALVCPNEGPCFQCDHKTAKRYEKLYATTTWDGAIVFLPLNKKP